MSFSAGRYPGLPPFVEDKDEAYRKTASVVNNILGGKTNNTGTVTLTANAASTVVGDFRATSSSVIVLMPTTANAAGAIATTYVSSRGTKTFTLTHANNAQVDKTFGYAVVG